MATQSRGPRRKVIQSWQTVIKWSNLFECSLECGHIEVAGGRTRVKGEPPQAPLTVACSKCAKEKEKT